MTKTTREFKAQGLEVFFKTCYENGEKKIEMLGVPQYIREAYKKYYAYREENG